MTKLTKTISARLPIGAYNELKALLKDEKLSISQFIQEKVVANEINLAKYDKGGVVDSVNIVDKDVEEVLLPILGGAGIGMGVYYVIKEYMRVNYPEKDAEQAAMMGAAAIGIGSVLAISHITKNK